mmetsp:Transcript_40315/g.95526  ORF Transcript_40315/g.95526 Transcript_40315/m.95526 type:complete len:279 (+) Transcript_40315:358-1194(+)
MLASAAATAASADAVAAAAAAALWAAAAWVAWTDGWRMSHPIPDEVDGFDDAGESTARSRDPSRESTIGEPAAPGTAPRTPRFRPVETGGARPRPKPLPAFDISAASRAAISAAERIVTMIFFSTPSSLSPHSSSSTSGFAGLFEGARMSIANIAGFSGRAGLAGSVPGVSNPASESEAGTKLFAATAPNISPISPISPKPEEAVAAPPNPLRPHPPKGSEDAGDLCEANAPSSDDDAPIPNADSIPASPPAGAAGPNASEIELSDAAAAEEAGAPKS